MNFATILLIIMPFINCKMIPLFTRKPIKINNSWWNTPQQVLIVNSNNPLVRYFTNNPHIASTEEHLNKQLEKLNSIQKPSGYTILPKSLASLDSVLMTITESRVFQIAKYTVAIPKGISVQSVAEVLWNYRFPDSIIIQIETTKIKMYKIDIVECSTARANLCEKTNIFNFKTSFLGCPLRIIWSHYPPFIYFRNHTNGWRGIFIEFLEPLGYLSQRPITFAPDDSDYFFEISSSYSYNTVVEDLVNETLIFVGSTLIEANQIFHMSSILTEDSIVVLAPRLLTDYWQHLADTLSTERIIYSLCTLLGVTMVLFLLYKGETSFTKLLLDLFGVLLTASGFRHVSNYWNLRIFIGLLLLTSMVINLFAQGSLLSIFTGPMYEPPLTNMKQLLDSKWIIKSQSLFRSYLEFLVKANPELKELLERTIPFNNNNMEVLLDTLIEEKNFATFMASGLLLTRPNIEKAFGYFPFLKVNLGLAMKQYEYSSPHICDWILRMLETGFLEKYKRLHLFQLALKHSVEIEEKKFIFSLTQFWPALLFLFFGNAIAIGVLVVEIAYTRSRGLGAEWAKSFWGAFEFGGGRG